MTRGAKNLGGEENVDSVYASTMYWNSADFGGNRRKILGTGWINEPVAVIFVEKLLPTAWDWLLIGYQS